MNVKCFLIAIHNDITGLAEALDLSVLDVLDIIRDDGFFGRDLQIIKDKYSLTDSQICSFFF